MLEQDYRPPIGETDSNTSEFWERGFCAEMVTYDQQLDEITTNPTARTNIIASELHGLIETGDRSRLEFTEREGLVDLNDFLNLVRQIAQQHPDEESKRILQSVEDFKAGFHFVGQAELDEACHGVAQAWLEYLQGGNYINLYVPNTENPNGEEAPYLQSAHFVKDKVLAELQKQTDDPEVLDRLKLAPDEWTELPNAKTVYLEDWSSTGTQLNQQMRDIGHLLNHQLKNPVEAHLLVAQSYQLGLHHGFDPIPYAVRGFFLADSQQNPYASAISGAHSSVDYGFENPLESMQTYLKSHNISRELPLLAYLERPYRSDQSQMSEAQRGHLARVAQINGELHVLGTKKAMAEHNWQTALRTGSPLYADYYAELDNTNIKIATKHNERDESMRQFNQTK